MPDQSTNVQDLLSKITEQPVLPKARREQSKEQMYGLQSPAWGAPTPLDGGDAGSRLGIDMGEPTIKAAQLRFALLHDHVAAQEKLAFMPGLGQMAQAGRRLIGGLGNALAAPGRASRAFFANRHAAGEAAGQAATAARQAAHAQNVAGMAPGAAARANVGFRVKELARSGAPKALGVAGTGMGLSDLHAGTSQLRTPNIQGYGHG